MTSFMITLAWVFSFISALYAFYFILVALLGLKKNPTYPQAAPQERFAVLIAARNEEAVIGGLVESLMVQDYPKELYDVIVIPNNCTDDTAGAARRAGATIWDCTVPVRSKGQVLTFAVDKLLTGDKPYNAICVFDADNLVDPGFLREMNNARCAGVQVAQAYRDSKNPLDTLVSGCGSIYYWMLNKFYNTARRNVKLSAIINGSGFMADLELLRQWGGWKTFTMVEDVEFTGQCALRGVQVGWVPAAITYDEQPLAFSESWKQRKRWSTGMLQCLGRYAAPLSASSLKGSSLCPDILLLYLAPVMQLVCLIPVILGIVFHMLKIPYGLFPHTYLYYQFFFSISCSFLGSFLVAIFSIVFAKKRLLPMLGAAAFYWVFIMSWIPINFICLFRQQKTWEPIQHTRSISPNQFFSQSAR